MAWSDFFRGGVKKHDPRPAPLSIERLETRTLLASTSSLVGGVLTVMGGPGDDRLTVCRDEVRNQLTLLDGGQEVARFDSSAVNTIAINVDGGNNVVRIENNVFQPAVIVGGPGNDVFYGGGGPTTLDGGDGINKLVAGSAGGNLVGGTGSNQLIGGVAPDNFIGGPGANLYYNVKINDTTAPAANVQVVTNPGALGPQPDLSFITAADVGQLLARAAGASSSNDAIIAIVDREGNILGVRVESGVSPAIQNDPAFLSFAIDGAIAKARTAAFFANNQAPLTSRTVQFIAQSTITQREVDANPNITDPNSTVRGPGYVAPVGLNGHFPPGVPFTPQVDLAAIEHSNRDSRFHPGPDHILGTGDDILLPARFNADPAYIPPGQALPFPNSYGLQVYGFQNAQNRGIGTLPGGIPIFQNGSLVGGIGVFFPGKTGFATEENSALSQTYDPTKPDRSLEAEYIAFAAVGGSPGAGAAIGTISGIPPVNGVALPSGRIDLVGITLDIVGPGGTQGITNLLKYAAVNITPGNPNDGTNVPVNMGGATLIDGTPVPEGFIVVPHDGVGSSVNLTAADVNKIIADGINQANLTRAAIRLPLGSRSRFVFAVTDTQGNVLGLYRMQDATYFSLDIAVAKARNVAYYADPTQLQPQDQVPGIPAGVAFTNRTFRYLQEPRFPEGIDGSPPGPFSILNDGGVNRTNGVQLGPPLPASAYQSVLGYDSFNPETNFRDPSNIANQNGVVFFPGSIPLYKTDANGNQVLVGGLGISGDGVDEDDVGTFYASSFYQPPGALRVDNFFYNGVRLPFQKFLRNPEG
ncbi:MAG: heme-binding protein [Gemmataceae bacterium]|nr:heme-binding protein [Gemmataceae bacterium]